MKGSVTPVVGTSAKFTAMCSSACTTIRFVSPIASSEAETIRRLARDAIADQGKRSEQRDQQQHTDKTPLLADHGEQEIVVGLGQESKLLHAVTKAAPDRSAAAQRDERLVDLVARRRPDRVWG